MTPTQRARAKADEAAPGEVRARITAPSDDDVLRHIVGTVLDCFRGQSFLRSEKITAVLEVIAPAIRAQEAERCAKIFSDRAIEARKVGAIGVANTYEDCVKAILA